MKTCDALKVEAHARRSIDPMPKLCGVISGLRLSPHAGTAAALALCAALAAASPLPALAANGGALADLARSIHRMQAACDRRAQARCELLATDIAVAVDASPRRVGGRVEPRRRPADEPPESADATELRAGPATDRTD